MRFLSFIHENKGEVNVMDKNLGLAMLRDLQYKCYFESEPLSLKTLT